MASPSVALNKSASRSSLSSTKTANLATKSITNPKDLKFPQTRTYYIYQPAGPGDSLLKKLISQVSLLYYKYLLHTGLYVMTTNEQRIVNLIVIVSVILSVNQFVQLLKTLFL